MNLEVVRFSSQNETTLGMLFNTTNGKEFLCFTLEDEYRNIKKYGETRIPSGTYKLGLRTIGGFHIRYKSKFGDFHKGMIEVLNVPNFKYVLLHIGNRDENTEGCLLVGDSSHQNITDEGFIGSSTSAYKRIYPDIVTPLINKINCWITYTNYDYAIN